MILKTVTFFLSITFDPPLLSNITDQTSEFTGQHYLGFCSKL